ncbi:MAG: phage major capsid protein [Clostridia bacterium]|nr:phage major capsid protein [Clostridia bacterium]
MVTMQTADNALKSFYLGAVSDQLNKSVNPLLAQIKQTTADIWGKDVRRVVRYGVNGGIGAGTEDGNLPTAGGNHYAQFVTTLKNLFGTIEISDKAIRSSTSNEGAFVNLLNDEMEGLIQSSSFNVGRMLFGDGKGTLATVASIASGVFTVDTVKNIAEGMIVDFVDADGNVLVGGRTVTKVDRKGKKVSVNGTTLTSTNVPNNSRIVIQNSNGLEITGLGAIFSDSATLYGVNRADHDWMNPYKQTSVGTISETKIQTAIDYLEEVSGSKVNFIVCSWGVKRALAEQLSTYKRMVDTVDLEGGYKAMSFNGIPVVADRFCPDGTMYLLNTNDFCLHQLCDWQWLEGEDGKVLKQIAGKPVYTATLVKYAELVCTRPCGQAMLSGITEA